MTNTDTVPAPVSHDAAQVAELRAVIDRLNREISETNARAQRAVARAAVAELRADRILKEGWIERCAIAVHFAAPKNAVRHLANVEINSEREAAEAVVRLAKEQPQLVSDQLADATA
jgi:hypothetical protein